MTDFQLFPDAEYLAIRILKLDTAGSFGSYTPRIGSKLPSDPDWDEGVVTVQRLGGVPTNRRGLDHPNMQIDVWHENKADAHDIAQRARRALFQGEGKVYTTPRAVLTGVEDSLGLAWRFDSINLKPRYLFGVYLSVHAWPGGSGS